MIISKSRLSRQSIFYSFDFYQVSDIYMQQHYPSQSHSVKIDIERFIILYIITYYFVFYLKIQQNYKNVIKVNLYSKILNTWYQEMWLGPVVGSYNI